ncbi:hypothetical protein AMAG_09382 [Allomyces macrogynus ATCC 38327]|uniref:Uncharacterized protein n=1 Tax=Allomyces macrogynus (strain ATCC 38327) TaxID=578462 RepID=A0A0L0SPC8_ALLM3|nr:hypothetical protein AMAG_09382 [Allomyces macrogynus ATCC 38327]|eukprot:KNE64358.1 hypothetical protein AMAG_09382 [Allomyces macrogynus ATCC 38327]
MSRRSTITYPALADLLSASQRQPIPEVLEKMEETYRDVDQTFRAFQQRRKSSVLEQGPFNNIMSRLMDDVQELDAESVAQDEPSPTPRRASVASTRGGAVGTHSPRRRSSASVMAAAQLISQMEIVTGSAQELANSGGRGAGRTQRLSGSAPPSPDASAAAAQLRQLSGITGAVMSATSAPAGSILPGQVAEATLVPAHVSEPPSRAPSPSSPFAAPSLPAAPVVLPSPPVALPSPDSSQHGSGSSLIPGSSTISVSSPSAAAPPPVFQMMVAAEGEEPKARIDLEFIPLTPNLGSMATPEPRRIRSKSMDASNGPDEPVVASVTMDSTLSVLKSGPIAAREGGVEGAVNTFSSFRKWKSSVKKKKLSTERQKRLEQATARLNLEIPDSIRFDLVREALPVVQKMVDQYRAQLGDRDAVTQDAVAHLRRLQTMMPASHAHHQQSDDATTTTDTTPSVSDLLPTRRSWSLSRAPPTVRRPIRRLSRIVVGKHSTVKPLERLDDLLTPANSTAAPGGGGGAPGVAAAARRNLMSAIRRPNHRDVPAAPLASGGLAR